MPARPRWALFAPTATSLPDCFAIIPGTTQAAMFSSERVFMSCIWSHSASDSSCNFLPMANPPAMWQTTSTL